MDVSYFKFNHQEHGILINSGSIKKILSCDEIEEFFNIRRPKNIPKLGSAVRDFFQEKKFQEILLYNCSDTIIESTIYRLFEHKLNFCRQSLISFKINCEHIPQMINIEDTETWKKLTQLKSLKT